MDKKEIRKEALALRKNKDSKKTSVILVNNIIESGLLENYNNIAIYYPIKEELNVLSLMDYYKNKNFYLPKTLDEIEFISYKKGDILIDGPFNTKEPLGNPVNRDMIDCFIIPCVGIGKNNKRLGYGKGYYDRYLSGYNGLKIGVCYLESGNIDYEFDNHDLILDYKFLG